ncbi:MAG: hypothetical protein PHO63_05240 [Bacilli bacterium]|nr:hypothetical protein [Bacilli bacterium]MDD4808544.1 hypothetical protein [Bacilli bacterium]
MKKVINKTIIIISLPIITYFLSNHTMTEAVWVFANENSRLFTNWLFMLIFFITLAYIKIIRIDYKYTVPNLVIYFLLVYVFGNYSSISLVNSSGYLEARPYWLDCTLFALILFGFQSLIFLGDYFVVSLYHNLKRPKF